MKYVIDVPENRVRNGKIFLDAIENPATPYDESEAEQRGREEAWELIKAIGKMSDEDMADCFGTSVIVNLSYTEAREKYDAWKEIKVGDEIRNGGVYGIVTLVEKKKDDGICYHVVGNDGYVWYLNDLVTKRTGRHFPEVAELLEKLKRPN